jgi:putative ATP-dependent endonuclease of OLD family
LKGLYRLGSQTIIGPYFRQYHLAHRCFSTNLVITGAHTNRGARLKLQTIRLSNFQCFGPELTEVTLQSVTYFIGPNASGKTAALQALCRMFAFEPAQRRVQRSDFHIPHGEEKAPDERKLWIEADFLFPELKNDEATTTVPPFFGHMRLDDPDGIPRVRYRLTATLDVDGNIEETLVYVLDINDDGSPLSSTNVPRAERNHIQLHYLPARRDPSDHIAYGSNALVGRLLRAINWEAERPKVKGLTDAISASLAGNASVASFTASLKNSWTTLHRGAFFSNPAVTFGASEIEALLRHMSVSFAPGHEQDLVDHSRLSDGQKSMLYLSIVLSTQAIGRAVLSGENKTFDPDKLRPPVFTLVAVEEPENSLSPYYLGRIVKELTAMADGSDSQALIATHAPSMLKRVDPVHIRYLRLSEKRTTRVTHIILPEKDSEAYKFVREAVQSFPELYFSRLVVLGEGDSEEIVLPRVLKAKGAEADDFAITIAPLGGRHVNHFWRLLEALQIPYLTLLDLDTGRHQGGWGRLKYANDQLLAYAPDKVLPENYAIPVWNSDEYKVLRHPNYLEQFEARSVFFSAPLDLDFAMMQAFPVAYGAVPVAPAESTRKAVLGDSHCDVAQYTDAEQHLFGSYHKLFKLSSKPAAHIDALTKIDDEDLLKHLPASLNRLADAVIAKLAESHE